MAWKKGQSGNPTGRARGVGKINSLRDKLMKDADDIIKVVREQALAGDISAARLLLERMIPPVKAQEQAQVIELPKGGTLTQRGEAVLLAAAAGQLAPAQAAQLIAAIGGLARVAEIDELQARIAALEALSHGKPK